MLENPQQINNEDIGSENPENKDVSKNLYELDEYLNLSEDQKEDLKIMILELSTYNKSNGAYSSERVLEIQQKNHFSQEIIDAATTPEIVKQILKYFKEKDSKSGFGRQYVEAFKNSDEVIEASTTAEIMKQNLARFIEDDCEGYKEGFKEFIKAFDISENIIQESKKIGVELYCKKLGARSKYCNPWNLKKEFDIPDTIIEDGIKQSLLTSLLDLSKDKDNQYRLHTAIAIKEKSSFSEDLIQDIVREVIMGDFVKGNFDFIEKIIKELKVSKEAIIDSPEIREVGEQGIIDFLSKSEIYSAKKIIRYLNLSESDTKNIVKKTIIFILPSGNIDAVIKTVKEFNIPEEFINSPEVQEAAKQGIIHHLSGGNAILEGSMTTYDGSINDAIKIKNGLNVSEEIINSSEVQKVAKQAIIRELRGPFKHDAIIIKEEFNVLEETISSPEVQEAAKQGIINSDINYATVIKEQFNVILLKADLDYCAKNKKWKVIDTYGEFFDNTCQYLYTNSKEFNLLPSEFYFIKDDVDKLKTMGNEARSEYVFDKLKRNHENWTDEQNILIPFQTGSEMFGYSKMFEYISGKNITKHDALHNFLKIIDLYNISGLSNSEFFNNILKQVKNDTSDYDDGKSYHKLNNIANNINTNFEETLSQAKEYGLPTLNKLLEGIKDAKDVFSSWKMLKKYNELCQILNKKEILEQLKELEKTGDKDLYHYVEILAFHSNIEMAKVIEFWKNPENFLELSDSHTPDEVHSRKKPSNYTDIPNLDLTAGELRDALVRGYYDSLQAFEPLEINYKIIVDSGKYGNLELNELILKAIGKRRESILGEAKNPDKLFSELQKIFKENNINIISYLQSGKVEENKTEILEDIKDKIIDLIYDKNIGLEDDRKFEEYRAKINLKSDPDGVVAGNDTSCCMPFGSGKNNVYTFNPICSLFTVQRLTGITEGDKGPKYRTIAQSVLTKNIDIGKNISEVVAKLNQFEAHMHDVVSDDVLIDKQSIITCDNIEVSPNFKSQKNNTELLKTIYTDFFKEYIKQFAKKYNLDENKVLIGLGYTDANISLERVANTTVPEAPVGYSDNLKDESMLLDLSKFEKTDIISSREITIQKKKRERSEKPDLKLPKGISDLTFQDSLKVAYIEGKAYKDNERLIQYLHNMENALIAKDVNNISKNRPEMSFKYTGEDKKMHGYILAYEGKMEKDNKDSEGIVYVSDLASDGNSRAGGSLILAFVEAYKVNYIEKDNIIPIFAQFREQTSYQIIMKQLEKLSKDTGIKFEAEETNTYTVGNDTMHEVIIRAKK